MSKLINLEEAISAIQSDKIHIDSGLLGVGSDKAVYEAVNKACDRHVRMLEELATNLQPTCNQLATDCISRQAAIDIERNATVDTNPSHFEAHQKFTQFLDDAEVSSFGRWQWANGFNAALTAIGIDLKKLPSAQPTLYGYNIEHLELIAKVLQKEDLPPERVVEALKDIGRIVAIVRDEFEETLRKADGDVKISFNIPTMFESRSTSRPREEYEEIFYGDGRSIKKVANNDNNEM